MSISLLYAPSMRVGGEVLKGEVELRFPQIIDDEVEEVHVKLRGKVYAHVARQIGDSYVAHTEHIEIVRENVSLWTKGTSYPPNGSQVLRIPFEFPLLLDVQPSCQYRGPYKKGNVSYFIEVVGVRPGFLSLNRRVMRPFAVVPNDPTGLELRTSLQAGWMGARNTISRNKAIRRGIWGGFADVKMELIMPSLATFPLFTKIPFTLRVITTTKEIKYDEKDENQEVFPEPPRTPKEVTFLLRREVSLNARGWKTNGSETVSHLGGTGKSAPSTGNGEVLLTFEKKWTPSEKNKNVGTWKQETIIESSFELNTTPSFATPIFLQRNYLRLKVAFPGIGNNLEADIPIEITSGLVTPSTEAEAPPYDGPPAPLDLPPTYWAATDWDVSDEKVNPFGSGKK